MKKHQIITLIFLMWTLLVSTQVQDQLGAVVQTTYKHYSSSVGSPLPATQEVEPCDQSSTDEGASVVRKVLTYICVNPVQNIFH